MSEDTREKSETLHDTAPDVGVTPTATPIPRVLTRYVVGELLAMGGMGAVHVGLKRGALGFQRLVAIKRLHPHLAEDSGFVARFKDEIRIVSRLTHPNVIQTFDVVESNAQLALVMEFVDGVTLHEILVRVREAGDALPPAIAVGILCQALHGLHAAHEAVDAAGEPLHVVHRDVSPQNLMVARDGLVKVLDFGIAKASSETHVTRTGQLSGKPAYMAPEQLLGRGVDRRTDVFAAGVVLWEALTGERLFRRPGMPESAALHNILELRVQRPSELRPGISAELDRVVLRALERDMARRFASARDFALALEAAGPTASTSEIADMLADVCAELLTRRADASRRIRDGFEGNGAPPVTDEVELVTASEARQERARAAAAGGPEPLRDGVTVLAPRLDAEPHTSAVQGVLLDNRSRKPVAPRHRVRTALMSASVGVVLWLGARAVLGPRAQSEVSAPSARLAVALPSAVPVERTPPAFVPPPHASADAARSRELPMLAPTAPSRAALGRVSAPQKRVETARTTRVVAAPAAGATPPAGAKRTARAADTCSPPSYEDADGIRHFKRECL